MSEPQRPRLASLPPALAGPRLASPALPLAIEAEVRRLLVELLLEDLEANPVKIRPNQAPTDGTPAGRVRTIRRVGPRSKEANRD